MIIIIMPQLPPTAYLSAAVDQAREHQVYENFTQVCKSTQMNCELIKSDCLSSENPEGSDYT